MRRHSSIHPEAAANQGTRNDWATLKTLFPYLWAYKWRVLLALGFLVGAKLANVGVPLVLKRLVDHMTVTPDNPQALLVLPLGLLIAYGVLRLCTTLFTELREFVFARVTQRAVRTIALQVFRHLHALSLRFHLNRQTGGMSRDIERGTRGVSSLVSYTLFSILPTLVEITLVLGYLGWHYDIWFSIITAGALVTYIVFTVVVTEWRTHFRRTMNNLDSKRQYARDRFADQLRNRQILRQRGLRGAPLRRRLAGLRDGRGEIADFAVAAEYRAIADHRGGGDADPVARDARRDRRQDDAGRPGAGECLHDPAVHSAQLPRRDLPRDQAEPGRHGTLVRAARPAPRNRRRAACAAAGGARCRSEIRARRFQLRAQAADPVRRRFHDRRRHHHRRGRP